MGIHTHNHDEHAHHHGEILKNNIFGFWIYIMSDCLLFASLFATYIVLKDSTAGGLNISSFVEMPYVMWETALLLVSSFTYGLSLLAARDGKKPLVYTMMGLTFVLGLGFIAMEINEFIHLVLSNSHNYNVYEKEIKEFGFPKTYDINGKVVINKDPSTSSDIELPPHFS